MTELNRASAIGFKTGSEIDMNERYQTLKEQITSKLKDNFRPEFLNRLDKIIVFKPLGKQEIREIVDRQIERLVRRLTPEGIEIQVEDSAKDFIAERGFDPEFGARPIRRVITDFIENPLSEMLLTGKLSPKSPIRVLRRGAKLALVK
jgi:ATP-dependent Clp protease ATP-binding subunit ClpC